MAKCLSHVCRRRRIRPLSGFGRTSEGTWRKRFFSDSRPHLSHSLVLTSSVFSQARGQGRGQAFALPEAPAKTSSKLSARSATRSDSSRILVGSLSRDGTT